MELLRVGQHEGNNEKLMVALELTQLKVREKELWRKAYKQEKKRRQEILRELKKPLEVKRVDKTVRPEEGIDEKKSRKQEAEEVKKRAPQPQESPIMTMEDLLATGGITRCTRCEHLSYVKKNSCLRSEQLQGCQRGKCRDYREWRGVNSPFKDYDWPRYEDRRRELCRKFYSGEGCDRGNECEMKHGRIE